MGSELINLDELIIAKQLPVIEDKLDEALLSVKERLDSTANLVVTEENYKELKKIRADLNKEFSTLEKLRKSVKEALEAPIKKFEQGAYKRIADAYKTAIEQLDGNIKDVENGLKIQRQSDVIGYFNDYRQSLGIGDDVATFQKSEIKVGLSGSVKSLKEEAKRFLDKVDSDLRAIEVMDNRDEILVAYKDLLNVSDAIRVVNERHKRIEEERKRREALEQEKANRDAAEAEIDKIVGESSQNERREDFGVGDELPMPTEEKVANEQNEAKEMEYSTVFRVFGTLAMLKNLKSFLVENGFRFENINLGVKENG